MFGEGYIEPKKPPPRSVKKPTPLDIHYVSPNGECHAHIARHPNTDYHIKLMQYKQQEQRTDNLKRQATVIQVMKDHASSKFDKHVAKQNFKRRINDKYEAKIAAYQKTVEERRHKLSQLIAAEEQEYIKECINQAQTSMETLEEKKAKTEKLKQKSIDDNKKLVTEKRMQQYLARCEEMRTAMSKRFCRETKLIQLQQIRENEARREMEREINNMYNEIMEKEIQAKMKREEEDALKRKLADIHNHKILEKQIHGKVLQREEERKEAEENLIELQRLAKQLEDEDRLEKKMKLDAQNKFNEDLEKQLKEQKEFMAKRKKEEDALEDAFKLLADLELHRIVTLDLRSTFKRESKIYRENLKKIVEDRKREEAELDAIIKKNQEAADKKYIDDQCKVINKRREMEKNVIETWGKQLELKKKLAEIEIKEKEEESKMAQMITETNERLKSEYERSKQIKAREYADELQKQIKYNEELRKREKQEFDRENALFEEADQNLKNLVKEILQSEFQSVKHPFRRVLERFNCPPY